MSLSRRGHKTYTTLLHKICQGEGDLICFLTGPDESLYLISGV